MDFPVRYVSHNQMVLVFGWRRTSQGTTLTADGQQFILLWWIVAFPEAQHLETKPAAQRFLFWDKTHGERILKLQATATRRLSQIPMRRLKSTYTFTGLKDVESSKRNSEGNSEGNHGTVPQRFNATPQHRHRTLRRLRRGKACHQFALGNYPNSPQNTTIFINFHEEILGQLWF